MNYTNNAIYSRVRTAVQTVESSAFLTQTYAPVPTKFPTVFVREIGRLTPQETATMSNAQDIYETTWEAQIFTNVKNGSKEQAYSLMSAVKGAFRKLYFVETMEEPIEQSDKNIYCLVARFRRIIGSGEAMPTNN